MGRVRFGSSMGALLSNLRNRVLEVGLADLSAAVTDGDHAGFNTRCREFCTGTPMAHDTKTISGAMKTAI